jgi:hypothetical protein
VSDSINVDDLVAGVGLDGYYDTPRDCPLTELADELEIAKSTCSGTLHRAEETIVKRFVAQQAGESTVPLAQ